MNIEYGTIEASKIAVKCIICGETKIFENDYYTPFVCEKCKAAVMKVRKESEE